MQPQIEAARRAGYSDQEIQQYLGSRFQPKPQPKQTRPQNAGRAGGFKGFALDVLPFGRVIEKTVNPNAGQVTGGELLTEAILTAIPFGLGRVAKAGKAAKGVASAAKDAKRLSQTTGIPEGTVRNSLSGTTRQVSETAPSRSLNSLVGPSTEENLLQRVGGRVRGYGRGIISGVRPEGASEILRPLGAKRINTVLDKVGAKGTVVQQLDKVAASKEQAGSLINQTLATANRKITTKDISELTNRIKNRAAVEIGGFGVDPIHTRLLDTLTKQLRSSSKDLVGANDFRRRTVDDMINYNRRSGTPDPIREQLAQIVRRELDDFVTKAAPDSKKAKRLYADLEDAERALVINAPMSLQQTARSGGGILGKVASSAVPQKILSGTGRALQGTGNTLSRPIVSIPASQAGVRIGAGALGLRDRGIIPEAPQSSTLEDSMLQNIPPDVQGLETQDEQIPYPRENLLYDIQRDPGNADEYIEYYQQLQEVYAPPASAKPLSAEASKVLANANSGLTSLDQLSSMISKGGVPKGTVIPGRSLLGGAGANLLGTASYDTAARNIADVITRLRTGAALTESEERFYRSQLPQAFDDPETIQQKLQLFNDLFSSIANRTGSAGTSLEDALVTSGRY